MLFRSAARAAAQGSGGKQGGLAVSLESGDGPTGGNQGIHHGLVAHLGTGHVVQCLQRPGIKSAEAALFYAEGLK